MKRAFHLLLFAFCLAGRAAAPPDLSAEFTQANKLYEQGKFREAAGAYARALPAGRRSATIEFNLGNSFLKAGQLGRAVAAYRQARKLSPRDPDILANLQFARGQSGAEPDRRRPRWIDWLSLDEWTLLASAGWGIFFLVLAGRQLRSDRKPARNIVLGVLALASAVAAAGTAYRIEADFYARPAVVVVPEASVRRGPFEESQSAFTLRDGAEINIQDRRENWLEVSDPQGRLGWLQQSQIQEIR